MSETELRILTVALNQKNDCWVLCRKTELIFLIWGIWTHNYKSRKSEMGLRILTVAWKQKESLLSIVSENWTHFFKSRKSEKPYWAKKIGKIAIQHVQNRFGHFWDRFWAFLEFWIFFDFFENFRWIHGTMSKKTFAKKLPQDTFGH